MKSAIERRMEIANIVGLHGKAHVDELSRLFNVSGSTIRADLRFLEQGGFIIRSHGVAIMNKGALTEFLKAKKTPVAEETHSVEQPGKERTSLVIKDEEEVVVHTTPASHAMGQVLMSLLEPSDTVYIDANEMIRQSLKTISEINPVVMMTNDIQLMSEMVHRDNLKIIMPGGIVNPSTMKFTGSQVIDNVKRYRFNKAIIKIDGFNKKLGFFAKTEFEADLAKLLCRLSEEIIIVASTEQLSSSDIFWIGETNIADVLITEHDIARDLVEYFETNLVKVITPT
ncbi:DeoR/GlpR family DNA-binding transcription regulator [Photobacterium nomapromontoriensis]|uniref:DeoR/GlpR family DNA-binding transcription regulator n=1 Tax=Photobacterium nomapromontoriensis TaxID=2910237 RepID=UPI003D0C0E6C